MGKPKAPPPPDYAGAATAQGAANLDAARATAKLNNPNIINPYGTQTVTYNGPDKDVGTVTQTFSPEQQGLYEKELKTQGMLGDLGIQGANSLKGVVGTGVDYSAMPAAPSASSSRTDITDAMMSRVNTDTARHREDVNSNLIAAGIRPGTEAYTREMDQIDRGYNDARNQALLGGQQAATQDFGMDTQARNNAIAEYLSQRQTPLNEINALMSGSQVSNPFAGNLGYQGGASAAPAPIFAGAQALGQAQQNAYGQKVGSYNSMMSGLMGLGGAGAMAM